MHNRAWPLHYRANCTIRDVFGAKKYYYFFIDLMIGSRYALYTDALSVGNVN